MRVVIVGAGFGGLETATCLSETLGSDVDVTLIDKSSSFVFGFAKLDVMFGRSRPEAIHLPCRSFARSGVTFKQEIAAQIIARDRGGEVARYQGDGHCYIEFGEKQVAEIYVNFLGGPRPTADFKGATPEGVANKKLFGPTRALRWFGL